MTKADLVAQIAKRTGVERDEVLRVVETFMEVVKDEMAQGNNIYLRGFGSFVIRERAQKIARNISKQEAIVIPKHNVPSFKPSKVFSEMLDNNKK
ncbi:MAG: integration host factor subunit beta [Bacteroidales bacterium]|nr:integration host factor subunit beta [Porphyromonas sp.]MDD6933740.1 integration host factor subunit beta [Bacteroidales bacterium]MDY3102564.1 HU family DNA-binding protein [Porphyromonas sp.]